MTYSNFTTTTHGKCIIAGEHAVLRGAPALICPVLSKTLLLNYEQSSKKISAEFFGDHAKDVQMLFWSVLECGLNKVKKSLGDIEGHFSLTNTLPIGCGLGASAALCAAVSQWFAWKKLIETKAIFDFARDLEDLFHGKSSGVDIIGSLHDEALLYRMSGEKKKIKFRWKPKIFLHDSGHIGITAHCVDKVKIFHEHDTLLAERIDEQMSLASTLAADAFEKNIEEGLPELANAINKARICFLQWGLASDDLEHQMNHLLALGALAAKPTGSGNGGYILTLWENEPPPEISDNAIELIP